MSANTGGTYALMPQNDYKTK